MKRREMEKHLASILERIDPGNAGELSEEALKAVDKWDVNPYDENHRRMVDLAAALSVRLLEIHLILTVLKWAARMAGTTLAPEAVPDTLTELGIAERREDGYMVTIPDPDILMSADVHLLADAEAELKAIHSLKPVLEDMDPKELGELLKRVAVLIGKLHADPSEIRKAVEENPEGDAETMLMRILEKVSSD